ncbi:MAG: TonB-dependent receptor, partial [Bacteroidota bacterium]
MRFILALLFCFALAAGTNAQNSCIGTVRCTVVEAPGFDPIPFVLFEAIGRDQAVLSDAQGIIRLDSLCPEGIRLRVLTTGFEPDTFLVTPQSKAQRLVLRGSSRALKGTEVIAARIEFASTLNSDSLGQDQIDRSSGKVFSDVLEQMSGVTTLRTGQQVAKPVIHGLHSQRLLILHAGVRLEGQQWGTEHAPEIDPFAAGRITVLKGGSALRYGADAIGGVILVEPREIAHEQGIRAELNAVGMSNGRQGVVSAMAEQHLGRFFDLCWRLQGTIKRGGNIR